MRFAPILRQLRWDGRSVSRLLRRRARCPLELTFGAAGAMEMAAEGRHDDLVHENGRHPVLDFYRQKLFPALCQLPGEPAHWEARYRVGQIAIDAHLRYGPVEGAIPWAKDLLQDLPRAVLVTGRAANLERKRIIRDRLHRNLLSAADQLGRRRPADAIAAYELLDRRGALAATDFEHYVRLLRTEGRRTSAALHAYMRYQESRPSQPDPEVAKLLTDSLAVNDSVAKDKLNDLLVLNQRFLMSPAGIITAVGNIGRAYLRLEDPSRALPYLQDACEFNGKDGETLFLLGQARFHNGDFEGAAEAFAEAAEKKFSRPKIASWQAVALSKTGDYEGAFQFFADAEQHLSSELNADFYVQWGRTCFKRDRFDEALTRFQKAEELDGNEWRAWTGMAISQLRLDSAVDAGREILRDRMERNGKSPPPAAAYLMGRFTLEQGDAAEAIRHFQQAHAANAADPEYALALGIALDNTADQAAIEPLERAAAAGAGGPEVVRRLALLHRDGNRETARKWLARLAELAPSPPVLRYIERDRIAEAVALFNAGDFAAAAEKLRALQSEMAESEWVRRLHAASLAQDAFARLKRSDDGVWEQISTAAELCEIPDVTFLRAFSAMMNARFEDAKSTLVKLAQDYPDRPHYALFSSLARFLAGDDDASQELSEVGDGLDSQELRSLVAFLEAHGAAGRGDHDEAAHKLLEWMKDPQAVRGLGLPRGHVNLFVVACFRLGRRAIRPARAPNLLRNLNANYGENFWRLAVVLMHHHDATGVAPEKADEFKIEACEAAYEELLDNAQEDERATAESHYFEWKLFLVRRLIMRRDFGGALQLLEQLTAKAGPRRPVVDRLRDALARRLAQASHEKAYDLLWRDANAARRVWEELLLNNPGDLDAIHHLACLHWSQAYQAVNEKRFDESLPHWKEGLEHYRQLYVREEYWNRLREKGRALCPEIGDFDEDRFEKWRAVALRERALVLIELIQEALAELDRSRSTRIGSEVMSIIYNSNLPAELQQGLSDELARRRLDPDPTQVSKENLSDSVARARQVIDIDERNVPARLFVVKAVTHRAQNDPGSDDRTLKQRVRLLEEQSAHADWLYRRRNDLGQQSDRAIRDLGGYYHELASTFHSLGQSETRAGNRAFGEAASTGPKLEQAQLQGEDYIRTHYIELLALKNRHNDLVREGKSHLPEIKKYYRKSDEAFQRALEVNPLDFEAKRLMEDHQKEYPKLD